MVITVRIEVGNVVANGGGENLDGSLDFVAVLCAVENHDAIQVADVRIGGNIVFAVLYRFKIALRDFVLVHNFFADLLET